MITTEFGDIDETKKRYYRRVSSTVAILVVTGGVLVLMGWFFDWPMVKGIFPGFATMKFNTALCFVLCGMSLWLQRREQVKARWKWLACGCASLAVLIGALSLAEYGLSLNLGIDEFVVRDIGGALGTAPAGRMAPMTGACFVLYGVSLLLLDWRPWRRFRPAEWLALIGTFLGLVAVEGYLLGISALYRFFFLSSVALNTAVLFVLLGAGILCSRVSGGVMSIMASHRMGGYLVKRSLPLMILLPTLLAWVVLKGHRAGLYEVEVDLAIFATISMALFAWVMWSAARELNQLHAELEKRNDANARFATIVESFPSAVIGFNLKGEVVAWSRGAEIILGYTAAETLGHSMRAMIPANQLDMESVVEERLLRGDPVENYETVRRCKDQSMKDVMVAVATLRDTSGRIVGYSRVERDITQNVKDRVALRDVQEQLKVIVEHLSEGLIISDSESRLVHWNPAALRMHGMESNDDWNRPLPEFSEIYQLATMDGQVVGPHHWPIARVLKGEVVHDLEMRVRHLRQGWEKIFSYSGTLAKDAFGRPVAFVTVQDITERTLAAEKL